MELDERTRLNDQLKKDIDHVDNQINEAKDQLRAKETELANMQEKISQLEVELNIKENAVIRAQQEYEELTRSLYSQNVKLDTMKISDEKTEIEKRELTIEIEQARLEKDELLKRLDALNEMNSIRIGEEQTKIDSLNIQVMMKKRLIAASVLFVRVGDMMNLQKQEAFCKLAKIKKFTDYKLLATRTMLCCLDRVASHTRMFIFRDLKYQILNWPKARDINDNISKDLQASKIKTWAYGIWRKKFNTAFIKDLRKNIAVTFLEQTLKEQDKRKLSYYMTKWYRQSLYQRRVRIFIRHLIWRNHVIRLRQAFETWALQSSNFKEELLKETYLEETRSFRLMYSYFHALRKYTEDEKKARCNFLRGFFNSWKRTCRIKEAHKNLHKFFDIRAAKVQRMKLYSIFQVLKLEAVKCKIQKVHQKISEVNEENRQVITNHIDFTRSANMEQRRRASNMILLMISSKPRRFLRRWKSNAAEKSARLREFWHRVWANWRSLKASAFAKWLSVTLQYKKEEVSEERRQEEEVHTQLELQIERHRTLLDEFYEQESIFLVYVNKSLGDIRTQKLGELLKYIDNRILRKGFRKYMLRTRRLRKEEFLLNNMFEYIEKSAYRKGFNGIRLVAHHKAIEERHERLLRKSNLKRNFLLLKVTFDSWRDFIRIVANFKVILRKFDIRVERMIFKRKFHKWASYAHAMHQKELKKKIQDAETRKLELERKLQGDVQQNIQNLEYIDYLKSAMHKVSAHYTKRLGYRDRIQMLRQSFSHWRDYKNFLNSVNHGFEKVATMFRERNIMSAFNKLVRNRHGKIVRELTLSIEKASNEKKSLRLDYQKFVEDETKQYAERAEQINKLEMDIIALQKKKDNLILNFLMRNQRAFNDKLLTVSFSFWKGLYRSRKASANKLTKALNHALLRKAMERLELKRYMANRTMAVVLKLNRMEKINKSHTLFSAFALWRRNAQDTKIQILEEENMFVRENLKSTQKTSERFRDTIIEANRLRRIIKYKEHLFHFWKVKVQRKKDFKNGIERVKDHLRKLKVSYYINELKERMHKKRIRRLAFEKFREMYNKHLLEKYFKGLKVHLQNIRVFALCLYRYKTKLENTWLRETMNQLSIYSLKKYCDINSAKLKSCKILERILQLKIKCRLLDGFREIDTYYHYLLKKTRVFVTRFDYVYQKHMRSVFNKIYLWGQAKYNSEKNKVLGPMADKIRKAEVRLHALRTFFKDEGYSDENLRDIIKRGEEKRLGSLRAGVTKLILNANNELALPKALNSWKEYTANSKKAKKFKKTLLNFLERADLFQAFRTWKKATSLVPEVSKQELIEATRNAEKEIKQLVTLRDTKWELYQTLESHINDLTRLEPAAVKLALLTFKRAIKKTMTQYWTHWNKFVAFCKEEDYNKLYDEASERIMDLRQQIKVKKQELEDMHDHNQQLKQIIFESTKTARDLRALMDEREQLSLYIVDKATIIKKLVEENAILQQRINSAKHEAKQLIALTKQITGELVKP